LVLKRSCNAMRASRFEASRYCLATYSGSEYVVTPCLLVGNMPATAGPRQLWC
jgi:hypothetical protein